MLNPPGDHPERGQCRVPPSSPDGYRVPGLATAACAGSLGRAASAPCHPASPPIRSDAFTFAHVTVSLREESWAVSLSPKTPRSAELPATVRPALATLQTLWLQDRPPPRA